MRLFHVSETADIPYFEPRAPYRFDLDQSVRLVWAISEKRLMNFLTPRDCPRVTFYAKESSTRDDVNRLIGSKEVTAVVAIEQQWFRAMLDTILYVYEFDPAYFTLQDEMAGYYVSTRREVPSKVTKVDDLFAAQFFHNVEVRLLPNLWDLRDMVVASSLGFSMCRMGNALPRR